jgi:NAD(P)-dependent dehydrogenase (short-subunit alcohol dehydrogenase family)
MRQKRRPSSILFTGLKHPGFWDDASKAGLLGLPGAAAIECVTSGIRVNVICPGPTDRTLLVENLTSTILKGKEDMSNVVPMKRLAQPEEMAETVIWLCSDAASFVTGQALPVDGG